MTQPSPARPYRVLVTGSRDWTDHATINGCLADLPTGRTLTIVHGACPTGADAIISTWARARHFLGDPVTEERHPAKGHPTQDFGPWPGAGPRRNAYMVSLGADLCLAFIGPCTSVWCRRPNPHPSHGASGCADLAEAAGIPTTRRWAP
ncbi:SLOG family protein [Streptomyces omiyaensis]|uniref:SLOG family protein n=1 Tax=Streptomyces omiyaensis TaxID=68247 RepID=UPI0036FAF1E9